MAARRVYSTAIMFVLVLTISASTISVQAKDCGANCMRVCNLWDADAVPFCVGDCFVNCCQPGSHDKCKFFSTSYPPTSI